MCKNTLPPVFRMAKIARDFSDFRENSRRMGAAIAYKGKIMALGFNQNKTHPKFTSASGSWTIHAEISALLHCVNGAEGMDIYIYRERILKSGIYTALAKPCDNCLAALIEAGIKKVYFTIGENPYWCAISL